MQLNRREGLWALAALPLIAARAPEDDPDWLPNVFISPCGEPFRARPGAPYPSVDWFHQANKAKDGKLTKAELAADAQAFFDKLDVNRMAS
jgi:hypothetical protein